MIAPTKPIIITLPGGQDAVADATTWRHKGRTVAEVEGVIYLPGAFTVPSAAMLRNIELAERRAQ